MLKKEKLAIIRKWYPNTVSTIDSVNKLIDFDEEKEARRRSTQLSNDGGNPFDSAKT